MRLKILIVENDQMKVLLAMMGMNKIYEMLYKNTLKLNKQILYRNINKMIKKGLLCYNNGRIIPNNDMKNLLEEINYAKDIFTIKGNHNNVEDLNVFICEEQGVIIQPSWSDKNSLKLSIMDLDKIHCYLLEKGYSNNEIIDIDKKYLAQVYK